MELLNIPPSAGHLDRMAVAKRRLQVSGWMFQPGCAFERIDAYLDGRLAGPVELARRPDVDQVVGWAKDGSASGFTLMTSLARTTPSRLDLVGYAGNAPVARLSSFMPSEADQQLPQPPEHLARRVSKLHGPAFRIQGLKMFTDLADQMARAGIRAAGRMLDWGCGCGRVAHHVLTRLPQVELVGCDIDSEAIAWCRQNLAGRFISIDPRPPSPFKDAEMDMIIACSVLTHLGATEQERWLAEMKRILAPGGYFLASTNGEFGFQLMRRRRTGKLRSVWERIATPRPTRLSGISDSRIDRALDGIAPRGYYRRVFQAREYTVEVCSKYFEVLDYIERGLDGHQDVVILRRAVKPDADPDPRR